MSKESHKYLFSGSLFAIPAVTGTINMFDIWNELPITMRIVLLCLQSFLCFVVVYLFHRAFICIKKEEEQDKHNRFYNRD